MGKKLELKTFTDLTRENQIKVVLYLLGALILIIIGATSLAGGFNVGSAAVAAVGIGVGAWLGKTGYDIFVDPKNAKKCNAAYWTVTNRVGYDPEEYSSDLDITLCEAQLKAQYGDYAGFFCTSNTSSSSSSSPVPTNVDVFYIRMTDSKKLNLTQSGASNVFTIKTGENKIRVTEPPGTFRLTLTSGLLLTGTDFDRIDDTQSITISFGAAASPSPAPQQPPADITTNTVDELKSGIQLTDGSFASVTVSAKSKTTSRSVTRTVTR